MEKTEKRKNVFRTLFIISLALLFIISSLFAWANIRKTRESDAYATTLQNAYTRSFSELSSTMNEIDSSLNKLLASSTRKSKEKLLLNIWKDCSSCEANLSALPLEHESVQNTLTFVNRLGEYCYFLSTKLVENANFSDEDFATLQELSEFSHLLNYDLALLSTNISNGNFKILEQFNGTEIEDLTAFLDTLNEATIETPSMIYDGPYSASQQNREIKGLSEEVCNMEEAKSYLAQILEIDINKIAYTGETLGDFETYNFEIKENNISTFVQITKRGKFLLQLNRFITNNGSSKNLSLEDCEKLAKAMFDKLEIKNMEKNWINETDDEMFINFAPKIEGIVIYSDLIKIKVDKKAGIISGLEAVSYAYNHTSRSISNTQITEGEAKEIVSSRLNIKNIRLAIIPKNYSEEVLAYELACEYQGATYYVYVNAITGEEEEIFRVVQDENQGELVI